VKAVKPGTALIAAWTPGEVLAPDEEFSALCAVTVAPVVSDDPVIIVEKEESSGCRTGLGTGTSLMGLTAASLFVFLNRRGRGNGRTFRPSNEG
jgi:hypothetical protein